MEFSNITEQAHDIHDLVRKLNMACSKLNGVAATIPKDSPFPIKEFGGTKVILHNVRYNFDHCRVTSSIKIPYKGKGHACEHSGRVLEFEITEDWFK